PFSGKWGPSLPFPENGSGAASLPSLRTSSGTIFRKRCLTPLPSKWTATALARARRTFLRFIDAQRTAIHLVSIETLDRGLSFARSHLNETKSTGLARFAVVDQLDGINLAMALEEHLDVLLGRGEGQIAHVDRRHPDFSLKMRAAEGAVPCVYRGQLKTGQGFKAHVC